MKAKLPARLFEDLRNLANFQQGGPGTGPGYRRRGTVFLTESSIEMLQAVETCRESYIRYR